MKRISVIAATVVALAMAAPVFAAEQGQADHKKAMEKIHQLMKKDPELKKQVMGNPHHILAMGYVKSLKAFAHALKKQAKQAETMPADFLKTAVAEMKRDIDEAEKHHNELLQSLSEETKKKLGDMPKMMAQHVENARTHLGHLEQLAAGEKVESKEVLKHLKLMMPDCDHMDKMHDHGEGKKMKKMKKSTQG